MPLWRTSLPAFGLVLCLSGCATIRSYDKELHTTLDLATSGYVDGAIRTLESNNPLSDKDLLFYLELGMLQRLGNRYLESQKSWMRANSRIQIPEQSALPKVLNLLRGASSYVINDKLRSYEVHDYEKVMLLNYFALNYLAIGDYESARVAIKQTHELEAVIREARAKAVAEVEAEAKKRGAPVNLKELDGYPVEIIDNPAVNALKNSYQSALSHYLAGFIYESLGETSLAAPGYRLANELQPNTPLLESALRGLNQRAAAPGDGLTDVLFVLASGSAPALKSRQFRLPIRVQGRLMLPSVSFPVMAVTSKPTPLRLTVGDGVSLSVAPITSVDLMARRQLKDNLPGLILRATIRSTTMAVAQYQLQHDGDGQNAAVKQTAAIAFMAGSALIESADERIWRTLPAEIFIARTRLPAGAHLVTLQTPEGVRRAQVKVSGRYAVVEFRLLGQQLFVQSPSK